MLHQFTEKIKGLIEVYFWGLGVFLVVVIGVGLWRLTVAEQAKFEPKLVPNAFEIRLDGQGTGNFVASKNGKVYYPKACKSASRIKDENRLFFASALEAEGAGYSRSAQCK
ncbi:MAG: hypothetical protein EXS68_00135 [Candidatus Ryanbacteria bacterium]|nr:hypothetical protein [Candidatus Ryanbacteria bacterium]